MVLMLFGTTAMAAEKPIDDGSMILGGNVYLQARGGDLYENAAGDGSTQITIAPEMGYFLAPGLMIGFNAGFSKYSQGDNFGWTEVSFGPMGGFYLDMGSSDKVSGSFYPFVKGFINYTNFKYKNADDSYKTLSLGGSLGMDMMISNAVAVEMGLRLSIDSEKYGDMDAESGVVLQIGAGIVSFVY